MLEIVHTRGALIKRININNLRNTVKFKHFNEVDHEILNLAWLKKLHAYTTSLSTNQLFYSNFASKKETYVHRIQERKTYPSFVIIQPSKTKLKLAASIVRDRYIVTNSQSFEYPIYTLETTLISRVIIERKKKKKKRTTNERVNKIDPV